jgi:hypothetical protein
LFFDVISHLIRYQSLTYHVLKLLVCLKLLQLCLSKVPCYFLVILLHLGDDSLIGCVKLAHFGVSVVFGELFYAFDLQLEVVISNPLANQIMNFYEFIVSIVLVLLEI